MQIKYCNCEIRVERTKYLILVSELLRLQVVTLYEHLAKHSARLLLQYSAYKQLRDMEHDGII